MATGQAQRAPSCGLKSSWIGVLRRRGRSTSGRRRPRSWQTPRRGFTSAVGAATRSKSREHGLVDDLRDRLELAHRVDRAAHAVCRHLQALREEGGAPMVTITSSGTAVQSRCPYQVKVMEMSEPGSTMMVRTRSSMGDRLRSRSATPATHDAKAPSLAESG